jgi:NADH-quinone oxidoreductase subunit H
VLKDYREARVKATATPPGAPTEIDRLVAKAQPIWPQTENEMTEVLEAEHWHAQRTKTLPYAKLSPDDKEPNRLDEYNKQIQFAIMPHADIGIIWVFAISSLTVYAVLLSGWSSNNKYGLIGSLRSSAQLISYEIPLGMSVIGVMIMTGSLNLERIIQYQYEHGWNVLFQPLAAVLFLTSVMAECNRLPFDLPECEQELVAGYHTEYGALKFGLFMLGEYTHMVTTTFLVAIMFFGGWLFPGITAPGDTGITAMILKVVVLGLKMTFGIFLYMHLRWTLPRFRFDQLMGLTWKVLTPLALAALVAVVFVKYYDLNEWVLLALSLAILIGTGWITIQLPEQPTKMVLDVRGPGTPNPLGLSRVR